jgi:hypothetical protein
MVRHTPAISTRLNHGTVTGTDRRVLAVQTYLRRG